SRLASMRGRKAHEVFGIARASTLDHYRTAFFRLVKPFHPDKLPNDTHLDLRAASEEMFKFLSALMVEAEAGLSTPLPRSSNESSTSPRNKLRQTEDRPPAYGPGEFIGIRRGPDFIEATVRVNASNVGIFTDHSMVNLSTMGVFLPTKHHLPLG